MNEETRSKNTSIEMQVLGFMLNHDFYGRVKNIITRDMFEGRYATLFDTISYSHKNYATNLTRDQLDSLFMDRNPAMPHSAKHEVFEIISGLSEHVSDAGELEYDVVKNFWVRDRARQIGEKAIAIFTGESEHFGELKTLIDMVEDGRMSDKTTYSEMDKGFSQLIQEETGEPDFPFEWQLLGEHLSGMDRGNLGIIFARPEVGKTTFCAFLAAGYIKLKQKVVYWANEEPAEKIKLRIIQSYFGVTRFDMRNDEESLARRYAEEIEPYLIVMDSVGTSMAELNEYAQLNEPDVMFCDQLDKFRIDGEFNRGDEKLKEIYVTAREVAKRNKLLLWSVSQASFEAHDRQFIDYAMLDGSRTGKAGEADVIIGIGKTGTSEEENTVRHICISKNKLNGWHGMFTSHIDVQRGVYY
jgi:archaellum biogenesis ATPase FlaH|tara:strand:- start:236 stop:1474 length:1239 start_codon:yes stop_codon:yes gene_type:complete